MRDIAIESENTAVLFTDPQVDALEPEKVMWDQVGDFVEDHDNVDRLHNVSQSSPLEADD